MKKMVILTASVFFFVSCDFIMKDHSKDNNKEAHPEAKVVLGTDKDKHGCVKSAGYSWSQIRKECIRVFEEGYRLNPIQNLKSESAVLSAFVIFEENGERAELYLPDTEGSVILKKAEGKGHFVNDDWSLQVEKGYTLKKDGTLLYAGAAIEENQVTGNDSDQS
jgi:hypothetical protein